MNSPYFFFAADFLDRDFFEPDDLEVLLALALFAAVDADLVLEADFLAAPDFLLLESLLTRLLGCFSVAQRYAKAGPSRGAIDDAASKRSIRPVVAGGLMTSMRIY